MGLSTNALQIRAQSGGGIGRRLNKLEGYMLPLRCKA